MRSSILIFFLTTFALVFNASAQEKKVFRYDGTLNYTIETKSDHLYYMKFYSDSGTIFQEGIYTDIKHPDPRYSVIWDTYRPCGINRMYHPDGSLSLECSFDSLSEYHGLYKAYSVEQQPEVEVNYVHGKRQGQERTYITGKLYHIYNYENGIREGECYVYYEEDYVDVIQYKNGKLHGTWIQKNPKGDTVEYYSYVNDTLNGLHYSINRNGVKILECYYKNGKLDGKYISRFLGSVETRYYQNGVQEGDDTIYNEFGELSVKSYYRNGLLEGEIVSYDKGKILLKGQFETGKKTGIWYQYEYSDKTYRKTFTYKNDVLIEESPWVKE